MKSLFCINFYFLERDVFVTQQVIFLDERY